jgi:propanol-preferring alcohol dehydrogenase
VRVRPAPRTMRAMVLDQPRRALRAAAIPVPRPGPGQVLLRVRAVGVCRTDLHIVDGDLDDPKLPLVPGHEIVGEVVSAAAGVTAPAPGQVVGVPWLGYTCGTCSECRMGQENLCRQALFTGYTVDGGYAEYAVADARFCLALPVSAHAAETAPLLCAGLIGYRALRFAGGGMRVGLYGFGAAAHIMAQVLRHQKREVYAFTRPADAQGQEFARQLGAVWAGASDTTPPAPLDAALLFAPVGDLVPAALAAVRPGGTVVCAGIHMSDIPRFPYRLLWEERVVRSVANLTRQDGVDFLKLAPRVPVRTTVEIHPLEEANLALERLRTGRLSGAAVLVP